MTDNQLAILLESIALNLENEIHYLQQQLPRDLVAYKPDPFDESGTKDEGNTGIAYFPCTELLWDFAKKLREQAKSLETHQAD